MGIGVDGKERKECKYGKKERMKRGKRLGAKGGRREASKEK